MIQVKLPADMALVPAAHAAVAGVVRRLGFSVSVVAALRRAAEELASSLVERAKPWSQLDIELAHDEEDVYLRMTVDQATTTATPRSSGMTRLLLKGTIDSVDVGVDDGRAYGVVQLGIGGRVE